MARAMLSMPASTSIISELVADLSNYLDEQQVEAVKDGLTYGVVPKTC